MNYEQLKGLYGRLRGIKEVCLSINNISKDVGDDYNKIVEEISDIIGKDLASFSLSGKYYFVSRGKEFCYKDILIGKLLQFLSYLEYSINLSEAVITIGSLYNSIKDEELKSRCSDILAAPGNFDRVVNQATLVFEDRIRTKAKLDKTFIGVGLVNTALNPNLAKTILIISQDEDEHRGICDICRGIMAAFRNSSHHYLIDYSREDALKVCAFIDNLLKLIDNSKLKS